MTRFGNWMGQLQSQGRLRGAGRLEDEGRRLSRAQGRLVVDGPYAEAKEAVGGFFIILAKDMAEAVQAAEGCPLLDNEGTVEVRPLQAAPGPQPG
jgi:hypothetical protein